MSLPTWSTDNLLPPGAHACTLDELRERCVNDAPNKIHREYLFDSFCAWFRVLQTFVPSGVAWVDGGFVMRKTQAPHDVDVVIFPSTVRPLTPDEQIELKGLLTMQNLFDSYGYYSRVQPLGGTIDAFISPPGNSSYWEDMWSRVQIDRHEVFGAKKGFVELSW